MHGPMNVKLERTVLVYLMLKFYFTFLHLGDLIINSKHSPHK